MAKNFFFNCWAIEWGTEKREKKGSFRKIKPKKFGLKKIKPLEKVIVGGDELNPPNKFTKTPPDMFFGRLLFQKKKLCLGKKFSFCFLPTRGKVFEVVFLIFLPNKLIFGNFRSPAIGFQKKKIFCLIWGVWVGKKV